MFPDQESVWDGYPSIIDGIDGPYVNLVGANLGTIHFTVVGTNVGPYAFGVSASALLFWVTDEFQYSVFDHGARGLRYDGKTYVKRAIRSRLLDAFGAQTWHPMFADARHFAFVGGNDCLEFVTSSEPCIIALQSQTDLEVWVDNVRADQPLFG